MPKKIRRFDPRFGVTTQMLEAEGIFVGQEFRDHLVWSVTQLREKLKERQTKIITSDANLRLMIDQLPDRERLAIRAMIARDFLHIVALYELFLNGVETATGPTQDFPEELTEDEEPVATVPFAEWLFEP